MDTPQNILLSFVQDETAALAAGRQGDFWPRNHHRITPLIARAEKLLDADGLVDFHFHLLRLDELSALKSDTAFAALCAAYRRVVPLFGQGWPRILLPRLKGLLLFGYDDLQTLPDEPAPTLARYQEYLRLWRQSDAFSHMPGLLAKRAKFEALSQNPELAARVERVLLQSPLADYLPFPAGSPWIWALVLLALHGENSGRAVVHKLMQQPLPAEQRATSLELLRRCLAAAQRTDLLALMDDDAPPP